MDIIIKQEFVLKYHLNRDEMLVFSLLQTFKNVLSLSEITNYLMVVDAFSICISLDSLLEKELISVEEIDGNQYFKIK
jgi:hypothetical protein